MCPALKARLPDWDPIRGSHHGQQPKWLHQQAEYMTAPDHRGNVRISLAPRAPSVVEEGLRFVAWVLDAEAMTDVRREFGISRKTG